MQNKMILLHVAKQSDWKNAQETGFYGDFSIKKDGFIHCSVPENVVDVANDNLKKIQENMVLLCIDISELDSEIKWERRGNKGIDFPHIYGVINIDAVVETIPFNKNQVGEFYLPKEIKKYIN